jgi:hypothetical protein
VHAPGIGVGRGMGLNEAGAGAGGEGRGGVSSFGAHSQGGCVGGVRAGGGRGDGWVHGGIALLGGYDGHDYLDSLDVWPHEGSGSFGTNELQALPNELQALPRTQGGPSFATNSKGHDGAFVRGGGDWVSNAATLLGVDFAMGSRRAFMQTLTYGGKIWSTGGFFAHAHGVRCSQVESFEIGTWKRRREKPLLAPRAWHAAARLGCKLFVLGGNDGTQHLRTTEFLDLSSTPDGERARAGGDGRVQGWRRGPEMKVRRFSPGATVCGGVVFVGGGFGSALDMCHESRMEFLTSVEMLGGGCEEWVMGPELPMPLARCASKKKC